MRFSRLHVVLRVIRKKALFLSNFRQFHMISGICMYSCVYRHPLFCPIHIQVYFFKVYNGIPNPLYKKQSIFSFFFFWPELIIIFCVNL